MNTRITIAILFFLMPFSSVVTQAQVAELILPELAEIAGTLEPQQSSKEKAPEEEQGKKPESEITFEDEDYGYTGGKNFINSPQEKFFDEPLSYFGYDFFTDAPSTYSPATNILIPPSYVLGHKDIIKIILYGNVTASYSLEINRSGEIGFPAVGPVSIGGLTFEDARTLIKSVVANQIIGTEVNVVMGDLRSINIFVLGEAYQPGMYTISALSTLVNAIQQDH